MTADRPDPAAEMVVAVRGLSVTFAQSDGTRQEVLRGLDLEVPRGQFVALVGRSGGGKTTILNVLTGLIAPTAGAAEILGRSPTDARSAIGFVPARDALLPWRTALRNVEYGMELRGLDRQERRRRALHYLELVGLGDAAGRWPWQLSQGMRQRVALVRAWAVEPSLLLMDEPFAALDAQTREVMQAELLRVWEQMQKSVLFITHQIDEAVFLGDRVVVLSKGPNTTVREIVEVPFARPRAESLKRTPEFAQLVDHIWSLIRNS